MKILFFVSLLILGAFASKCHPHYECCKKCEVAYIDDEGQWGVEHENWCLIDQSHCHHCNYDYIINMYPKCNDCNIYYVDYSGNWGVENNNWCYIQDSKCTSVDNNKNSNIPHANSHKNVVPIISIVSKSGNNTFVTDTIAKHITEMIRMGPVVPYPYYENCTITIEDENGKNIIEGATARAKVRGNFTTLFAKKSLHLKFDEKLNLFGLNKGKKFDDWLLLAAYKDTSLLRDKTAFALARELLSEDGLYASDAKFVEVNINGEYWGVYLLAEVQEISKGRVSITKAKKNYTDTDIGYLLEHDIGYAPYEEPLQSIRITFNDNSPLIPYDGEGGNGITINAINDNGNDYIKNNSDDNNKEEQSENKDPNMTIKSDIYSQEQHDFIEKYMNNVYKIMYEAAYNKKSLKFNDDYTDVVEAPELTSKEAIENVVDTNSLADMYIISEFTCDADLYFSSFYLDVDFGKNGSKKLRFEAPWDFDSGFGYIDICINGEGFFAGNRVPDTLASGYQINAWLAVLMYEDWYQDIIRNKWTKAYDRGVFSRIIEMIHSDAKNFEEAFARNTEKWDDDKRKQSADVAYIDSIKQCNTEADAAANLSEWVEARVNFINNHWHK